MSYTLQDALSIVAGGLFAVSIFVFADGAVVANQTGRPYNFMMYVPSLLCLCGGSMLQLVSPEILAGQVDSFDDDVEELRAKGTFFIAAALIFAAVTVAIWKLVDPYSTSNNAWPGAALLIQVILAAACFGILFFRKGLESEEEF